MTNQAITQEIFAHNFASARRVADRLTVSVQRLDAFFPISAAVMDRLGEDTQERIDAFIKRFEQLQDIIENRLFRGLAVLEGEDLSAKSKRDLILLMEKFGILTSADDWLGLSILRNKLAHEYPGDAAKQAERLNEAFASVGELTAVLTRIEGHVLKKNLAPIDSGSQPP